METLLVCAILGAMMLASVVIYATGLNRQRKQETTTESYRAAMIALAQIRSQLRGSQLLSPGLGDGPQPTAVYRFPKMNGDLPKVDSQGMILWRPPVTFQVTGGSLQRVGLGETRPIANLGSNGSVTFERTDRRLLRLRVVADRPSADVRKSSHYEARADVYLPNN